MGTAMQKLENSHGWPYLVTIMKAMAMEQYTHVGDHLSTNGMRYVLTAAHCVVNTEAKLRLCCIGK